MLVFASLVWYESAVVASICALLAIGWAMRFGMHMIDVERKCDFVIGRQLCVGLGDPKPKTNTAAHGCKSPRRSQAVGTAQA
jgi:hypothetical protein